MRRLFAGVVAACGTIVPPAVAQNYPERPIEVTVPFSPGAVTDVLGRALAEGLGAALGQRAIVVNKAGATGAIGAAAVARAAPDGYSLLFAPAVSITVLPLSNKQVGYDLKAFDPICQTFKNEMVIVVNPNSPFKSVGELVAAAQARPGAVNYGHLGVASIPHLAMVEFSQVAKVDFNAIPFKGDADVMQQLQGGQLDFGAVVLSSAAGSGLRILGLFADARNPATPETPTVKEQGFAVAPVSFGGLSRRPACRLPSKPSSRRPAMQRPTVRSTPSSRTASSSRPIISPTRRHSRSICRRTWPTKAGCWRCSAS